jgi:DNA primase (bacterial type)
MERDCCTFAEAIETLCDFYNIDLQKDKVYVRQKSLAEQNEAVCRKYEKKLPVIHDYLVQKRGFSEEIIKLYRFGWSEKASALTIPLIDRYGRVSGFTYRFFDKEPKYKHTRNSELLEKRKFWFNLINARKLVKKRGRLWVVEGHLDAASGQQMGEAAIAYLGIVMSKEQLLDLKKTFEHLGSSIEIILVPDADGKAITHIPKVRNMFARWWPEANLRVALMEELNHE